MRAVALRPWIAGLALLAPGMALAQAYCDPRVDAACYQRWCKAQGGHPVYRGNWGCDMSSSSGGYSSGGAELGRQIGGALGELIREGLFGNPQQDAQRRAEMQEQRRLQEAESRRRAEELAREDEARYQRLRSSLLGFSEPQQLSPMGSGSSAGGLQLMLGEDAERSLRNPALAELERAAAWSTLAARAPTAEDAAMLAEAAFQSLVGGKVNLPPPPPDVKGVPVGPSLAEVEALKKPYLAQRAQVPEAVKPLLAAEERRDMFMRMESRARELEVQAYQGVRKEPRKKAETEAEAQRARKAAEEAKQLREQAEADAQRARAELERRQYEVNGLEQSLRAWLSSFAAGERKPDSYYYLGFEDGSRCFSQNAGPRCDKARAPANDYDNCLKSYRLGYTEGERIKKALLEDAHRMGEADRAAVPPRRYRDVDTRADGPCRAEYIMSYNNGRFGAALSRVGR